MGWATENDGTVLGLIAFLGRALGTRVAEPWRVRQVAALRAVALKAV